MERDARGGTRYTEIVRSHFGVISPDARLQRPEYIGGGTTTININPIAQTSGTSASGTTTPMGTLAAMGTALAHNHGFTQSFVEHGVILGIVAVRADLTYQQGLQKMWSRSTRYDFYFPAFATLENVPNRTAWVFAAIGISSIAGGLIAGKLSKRTSSLAALRRTYAIWFLVSLPMAFTYPGWSMVIGGAFLGFVGGAIQVFYWEVMEAVRPKGSATSYMGLLWTVEGTIMSLGAALGGWLCETIGAQITLSITSVCIGLGYIFLKIGKQRLIAADRIPTEEEDLLAMESNSPTTK